MNLEQLQAMSDEELNELAAVKVMGWENSFIFEGQRYNGIYGEEAHAKDWNPTSDMNDCFALVKKIPTKYRVEVVYVNGEFVCNVFADDITLLHSIESDDPARAITIASILASKE